MTDLAIVPVATVDMRLVQTPWAFATERRTEIDAHFDKLRRERPSLWNGQVLLMRDIAVADGVFHAGAFKTDFASFLAWRDWGFPDAAVKNCFAMAALRGTDGAFVLCEMGAHTANAGKIQFSSGTPDLSDIRGDGTVDCLGSAIREVAEETGLTAQDYDVVPGWHAVFAGGRIALMRLLQARSSAASLKQRILDHIAADPEPELSAVRVVQGPADLQGDVWPFVSAYLKHIWR